jgi:hypothetical protein
MQRCRGTETQRWWQSLHLGVHLEKAFGDGSGFFSCLATSLFWANFCGTVIDFFVKAEEELEAEVVVGGEV